MNQNSTINYFICHASEDKLSFVRPLAHYLIRHGAHIFYDEFSLKLGDSLSSKINEGLALSKNAIIVLSKYFFEKSWTQAELQGIFQRYISGDSKLLIVYHEISNVDVREKYPLLADILAVDSAAGIPEVTRKIFEATNFQSKTTYACMGDGSPLASVAKEGFSVAIRFQLHAVSDQYIDKYIFDFGSEANGSQVSLRLVGNRNLVAQFTDSSSRTVSISCLAKDFFQTPQFLLLQIAPSRSAIELYVNGELVAHFPELNEEFIEGISIIDNCILFNSIELIHPVLATLSFFATANEFSHEEGLNFFRIIDNFRNAIA